MILLLTFPQPHSSQRRWATEPLLVADMFSLNPTHLVIQHGSGDTHSVRERAWHDTMSQDVQPRRWTKEP